MDCKGTHRYFVAETGTVEGPTESKVIVILVCTSCGDKLMHEFAILGNPPQLSQK
jgi:hypothetical protein